MAVAMSSLNWPMRRSPSNETGSSPNAASSMAPHGRPLTTIGVATTLRRPRERTKSAIGPLACR
jgi:hypothetical protein